MFLFNFIKSFKFYRKPSVKKLCNDNNNNNDNYNDNKNNNNNKNKHHNNDMYY